MTRLELIKKLNKMGFDDTINCCVDVNEVVNFIIADRKRIVEPLFTYKKDILSCGTRQWNSDTNPHLLSDPAIDKSLQLAGVTL